MTASLATKNPQARCVRTGTTDDKTGVLNINQRLGFRPYATHTHRQIDPDALPVHLNTVSSPCAFLKTVRLD